MYIGTKGICVEPWPPWSGISGKNLYLGNYNYPPIWDRKWGPKEVEALTLGLSADDACTVGGLQQDTWPRPGLWVWDFAHTQLFRAGVVLRHSWELWGLVCLLREVGLILWKVTVLASCHSQCHPASPMGLNPYPFLSVGHGASSPPAFWSCQGGTAGLVGRWEDLLGGKIQSIWGSGFKSWLGHFLAARSWASHFPFLRPEFAPLFNDDRNSDHKWYGEN